MKKVTENIMREVSDNMKTIRGCKKSSSTADKDAVRANQFNHVYKKFS